MTDSDIEYIRVKDVLRKIGVSRSTLYDWITPKSSRFKPDFPKPVKLGVITLFDKAQVEDYLKKIAQA